MRQGVERHVRRWEKNGLKVWDDERGCYYKEIRDGGSESGVSHVISSEPNASRRFPVVVGKPPNVSMLKLSNSGCLLPHVSLYYQSFTVSPNTSHWFPVAFGKPPRDDVSSVLKQQRMLITTRLYTLYQSLFNESPNTSRCETSKIRYSRCMLEQQQMHIAHVSRCIITDHC